MPGEEGWYKLTSANWKTAKFVGSTGDIVALYTPVLSSLKNLDGPYKVEIEIGITVDSMPVFSRYYQDSIKERDKSKGRDAELLASGRSINFHLKSIEEGEVTGLIKAWAKNIEKGPELHDEIVIAIHNITGVDYTSLAPVSVNQLVHTGDAYGFEKRRVDEKMAGHLEKVINGNG